MLKNVFAGLTGSNPGTAEYFEITNIGSLPVSMTGWTEDESVQRPLGDVVRFVDEQLQGPYRLWVHEHTFVDVANGTLVNDRVRYRVPGGRLVNRLMVQRELHTIFNYRQTRLRGMLG